MTTVSDLMTSAPLTLSTADEVGFARDAMLNSGVHCLPVVDAQGHPIGVVSSWDLVEEYAPHEAVANAMTPRVLAIGPDEDVSMAAALMQTNFVHHLIVVEPDDTVCGVISSLDLLSELLPG